MRKKRWWLAIGAAVFAAAAAAVAVTLTGGGGGGPKQVSHPAHLSHLDYALLWQGTHVGDPKKAVLARWPKHPYQHYRDNLKDDCFEWSDNYLYNLCFSHGVLRSKDLL